MKDLDHKRKKRKEKTGGKIIGNDETFSIPYRAVACGRREGQASFREECRIGSEEETRCTLKSTRVGSCKRDDSLTFSGRVSSTI